MVLQCVIVIFIMKIEYTIISASGRIDLMSKVKTRIADGWLPQGGAFIEDGSHYSKFNQTMIRETDDD